MLDTVGQLSHLLSKIQICVHGYKEIFDLKVSPLTISVCAVRVIAECDMMQEFLSADEESVSGNYELYFSYKLAKH